MNRIYLSYDEAVSVLPKGEIIHTFCNVSTGLIGANWSRAEIENKLMASDYIEVTGEQAQALGHGICAYNKDTKWQSEILFIATDMDKIAKLAELKGTEEW